MPQPRTHFIARLLKWRFLFVLNALIVVFLGLTVGREWLRTHEIQEEIQSLQDQAQSLSVRNISLSELQLAVQTESYIEREARLKLGLKKPGEQVVVIQNDGAEQDISESAAGDADDPLGLVLSEPVFASVSNSKKWWCYFFDKSTYLSLKATVDSHL